MQIEILKTAQKLAASESEQGLPSNRLRLTLEYQNNPDICAERAKLVELLGGGAFVLEVLDDLLPNFLVLQFPKVERRMSPQSLFAAADALVNELGLVSAVPDIGSTIVVAPEEIAEDDPTAPDAAHIEGISDFFLRKTCWVKKDSSLSPDWAVKSVNAPAVWDRATGKGVVVAQPDTGVAAHVAIDDVVDLSKALNTLNGTDDATDPLTDDMKHPGHGTATASVVASQVADKIYGAAPDATVVPIRCIDSVMLGFDPTPVARAILHAVKIESDIISMSLGGALYSRSIARALEVAAANGIIVISAAGNCVQPIVIYPACDPNVIALAGTNIDRKPWKGSSRGKKIDLSAPGENVTVAARSPGNADTSSVRPGQGTSYAAAMTAGVAALWVEHFTRDAIRAEAATRGITVTVLFRMAAQQSAGDVDSEWFPLMGAGIVDAEALLALELADIGGRAGGSPAAEDGADPIVAALESTFEGIEADDEDLRRIGPESVFLLTDTWMRENRAAGIAMESPSKPEPSEGLKQRMPARVAAALEAAQASPDIMHPVITSSTPSTEHVKMLAVRRGTTESIGTMSLESAQASLRDGGADALIAKTTKQMDKFSQLGLGDDGDRRELIQRTPEILKMAVEGRLDEMPVENRAVLEALIRLNGRPSHRVVDGTIAEDDPMFDDPIGGGSLSLLFDLPSWTQGVGRIDLNGRHQGTGFLMGNGQVMTNRHVLEAIAEEVAGPGGSGWLIEPDAVTIDFSDEGDGSRSHVLTSVLQAGPRPINGIEDLENLDMAILSIKTGGAALPTPMKFSKELDESSDVIVIGYPARPGTSALVDPKTGHISHEIANRLRGIFGTDYGRKYLSPGQFIGGPGTLENDTQDWIVTHDCTTLGGSSGSMVIQLNGPESTICGLHFSGAPLVANKAHALGVVDAHAFGPIQNAPWI